VKGANYGHLPGNRYLGPAHSHQDKMSDPRNSSFQSASRSETKLRTFDFRPSLEIDGQEGEDSGDEHSHRTLESKAEGMKRVGEEQTVSNRGRSGGGLARGPGGKGEVMATYLYRPHAVVGANPHVGYLQRSEVLPSRVWAFTAGHNDESLV
jgi:hypothetical protein